MKDHDQPTAICLTNITKVYTIHHEKPTLMEKFIKSKQEQFTALKNITLEIKKGERVGIIGPNGSGKTTLLKIIAGITTPTSGSVQTHGRIVSLIDLEAGFHPDLTGIQNIYLNAMIIGMSKHAIDTNIASIISFADIHQFIDAPLFTYSEGMKLRLGFSVAVHANPDILILDEGLSVGDEYFRKKAFSKIEEFFKHKKTIITVTHYLEFIKKYCDRVMLMKTGKILRDGGQKIVAEYVHSVHI
jgi:ABC-type polysaccharide/polyol phosphate transport system ATPase subunit